MDIADCTIFITNFDKESDTMETERYRVFMAQDLLDRRVIFSSSRDRLARVVAMQKRAFLIGYRTSPKAVLCNLTR